MTSIAVASSPALAAVIFLKGQEEPLHVLTIREDASTLVAGVPQPDGTFKERIIPRSDIDELIQSVKPDRLGELSPDMPAAYRDYAEELAEKKADPDARAAAIRLYLIAAYLDPERLGRSSLLGLTALARSPAEERKFRAMAYLVDPKHDRKVLEIPAPAARAAPAAGDGDAGREALLSGLKTLRQGNGPAARRMLERAVVKAAFAKHASGVAYEEVLDACRGGESLPPGLLARLIRLELSLSGGAEAEHAPAAQTAGARPSWSAALAAGRTEPAPSLSLETLTEFDPRLCLYRGGKWVAPD